MRSISPAAKMMCRQMSMAMFMSMAMAMPDELICCARPGPC